MKKLLFKLTNDTLLIKERVKLKTEQKNILNTNIISANELVFSDEYIEENIKIVANFLKELTASFNVSTVVIDKLSYTPLILKLLENNFKIDNLILKEDACLTFNICEAIAKTPIKSVNCYSIQPFMIEYLDKHGCLIESRNEILFISNFMTENNLSLFSSLFYKVTLNIKLPMNNQDEEDFKAFCQINKYLKTINVNKVNKSDLETLVNILRSTNKKNIKIVIHDNISDEKTIEYLQFFNKRKSKKYKIKFRLEYSNEYLKENIVKETNNSILKICGIIIIAIIFSSFLYIFLNNYTSKQYIKKINTDLQTIIKSTDAEEIINKLNSEKGEDEKEIINDDIVSLYNMNPDVVAWLTVPNTNIDYAVTQTTNNTFYLSHNIYMKKDYNGWVFMDYHNDVKDLSDNLIFYGHNRYYSGVMFGPMVSMLKKSWYEKSENQIITVRTMYENLQYKIFSMYHIKTTTDYMQVLFIDDNDRLEFYNMLKDRSIYDFKVPISGNDKIITLSTCADDVSRYVVHAKLING